MQYSSRKQKGSVLVFSLLVLTILLASALAVMSVAVVEQQSSFATQRSVIAFQAADSGAERVLERIYQYNSPAVGVANTNDCDTATWPIGTNFPWPNNPTNNPCDWDPTFNEMKSHLSEITSSGANGPGCGGNPASMAFLNESEPYYWVWVTFLDEDGDAIDCNDLGWRDKVVKIRSQGVYRNTSRFIEMGVRPRE